MGQTQSDAPISTVSNPPQDDGLTWWCRIGARGICIVGGLGKNKMFSFPQNGGPKLKQRKKQQQLKSIPQNHEHIIVLAEVLEHV